MRILLRGPMMNIFELKLRPERKNRKGGGDLIE